MHEAQFYTELGNSKVQCNLCPWNCVLKPGQTGNCKVRTNENGKLLTNVYNRIAAVGVDPIEKKPFYHFYPGKNVLSIGAVGCNLHCNFCQNHRISQCYASEFKGFHKVTSEIIVNEALKTSNNVGIAYTYNEPFTFFEFMLDTAKQAKKQGLKNVVVSNGYINQAPLSEALPFFDAFNIDLKAFSNDFYKKQTKGELAPVIETLKLIAKSKTHLEITNLIIPGLNDSCLDFEKMVIWISETLGKNIPLHLSRYFPNHDLHRPPTPIDTLTKFYTIAKFYLHHVYLGNVSDEKRSSSYCPNCGEKIIHRSRYDIQSQNIDSNGQCLRCGAFSEISNR